MVFTKAIIVCFIVEYKEGMFGIQSEEVQH
jgi:hypothetical protein